MWTSFPRIERGEGLKGRIIAMPLAKDKGQARKMVGTTPIEKKFYEGKTRMIEYKNKIIVAVGVEGKEDARKFGATAWKAVEAFLGPVKFHLVPDFLPEEKVIEGAILASYKFSKYFTKPEERPWIVFHGSGKAMKEAMVKARATFIARDLGNEPPNEVYPASLAERAQELFEGTKVEVEVHSRDWLQENGFGGIIAVGKGSANKPRLIVMKYLPTGKKPVLLVGKGVSFDSGGINLKPTGYIEDMKLDMSGAAAVIGVMHAVSELGLKRDVVGIAPAVENMPSGEATRPGDVIKMFNGKTVEVWNTDAEGRLILADALAYGFKKFKPEAAVDLATLTGACKVALGPRVAGLMGNDEKLMQALKEAGDRVEEETWVLPMHKHYAEPLKSEVADIRNSAEKGYGGAMMAAKFLENFVDGKWAHIDIAGPASSDKAWLWNPKGGTGFGTRLVIEWLLHSQ
jgi:leucyl aminopeptidase